MEENKKRECPSCGNQMGGDFNRCALCGYVLDPHMPVTEEHNPENAARHFMPNETSTDGTNRKKTQPAAWIFITLVIFGAFFFFKNLIAQNSVNPTQLNTQVPTHTQKKINTQTISIFEDKYNAFKVAEKFSILMEEGDEEIKELLAPVSQQYDANLESINTIVHDTLKYGKYIKIYDLSISNYSSQNVTISGYLENRSYSGWLKYYLEINLSKYGNSWLITSWNLVKT